MYAVRVYAVMCSLLPVAPDNDVAWWASHPFVFDYCQPVSLDVSVIFPVVPVNDGEMKRWGSYPDEFSFSLFNIRCGM